MSILLYFYDFCKKFYAKKISARELGNKAISETVLISVTHKRGTLPQLSDF
jgi:hypothetical protein